jgi:hypothetical protein
MSYSHDDHDDLLEVTTRRPGLALHWLLLLGLLLPIVAFAVFVWKIHHPSPCAAVPEACRPAWREAR